VTRRPHTIGLLLDWLENNYQNRVLAVVDDAVRRRGAHLLCFTGGVLASPYRFGERRNFIYDLAGRENVDGLIVTTSLANATGTKRLGHYCERYRPLPMSAMGAAIPGVPAVLIDNASGMREVITHLITCHGLRRIAFIRGPGVNDEAEERYHVYRAVLSEHGLPFKPELVTLGNFHMPSGIDAVRTLLDERRVPFDAIVAANDFMALGAMEALHARGIRIPNDVALVGFDDIQDGRFSPIPLTTVRQPLEEQGEEAARLVLDQLDGKPVPETRVLRTELVIRSSCGCMGHMAPNLVVHECEDLDQLVRGHGEQILDDMHSVVHRSAVDVDKNYLARLLAAFEAALRGGSEKEFSAAVQETLLEVSAGGMDAWQGALSVLRSHLLPTLGRSPEQLAACESLLHTARALTGSVAERAQAQKRLELENWSRTLRAVGEALFTSLDVDAVANVVARQLPTLRIRSCFMVLYEGIPSADQQCRLVLCYDADAGGARPSGDVFSPPQLVPSGLLPTHRRYTYVVEPLLFEREQLGYVLFEMGPRVGFAYETLRDQIGSALKGALLVQQVVAETEKRQAAEREHLAKEMQIASSIQTSILPHDVHVEGLDIAAAMLPAAEVGGDYYDVLSCNDGCWLGIGDVAGHGLQTGLIVMMIQSAVAGVARYHPDASPSEVLRVLNTVLFENVRERLRREEHATFTLLRYRRSGEVVFSGAHEDIIVYRAGTRRCELIVTPGAQLAAVANIDAHAIDRRFQLADGDVLLLYTDGVVAGRDTEQQPFGVERLCGVLEQIGTEPVDVIRDVLVGAVRDWVAVQDDDITVLVARHRTDGSEAD
jgi:phosphoserine phosphatase RsbU/P